MEAEEYFHHITPSRAWHKPLPRHLSTCHDREVTILVTLRPTRARRPAIVEISGLPWDERPGSGYELIEEAIGAPPRSEVQYANGVFSINRRHARRLIVELADRFGRVHVRQFGGSAACDQSCWADGEADTFACECSCAGANHGQGGELVGPPPAAPKDRRRRPGPREYDVRRPG